MSMKQCSEWALQHCSSEGLSQHTKARCRVSPGHSTQDVPEEPPPLAAVVHAQRMQKPAGKIQAVLELIGLLSSTASSFVKDA